MAGGRPGPALFELLKDRTGTSGASQQAAASVPISIPIARPPEAAPSAPPNPPPAVRPPPVPPPRPTVQVPEVEPEALRPSADRPKPWVIERDAATGGLARSITISSSVAWLIVAGFVVWTFVVWGAAWVISQRHEASIANRQFGGITNGIRDPLKKDEPIPVNPGLIEREPAPPATNRSPAKSQEAPGNTPAPSGGDMRVPGFNYLIIATKVEPDDATRMVEFLNKNGVPAAASPVAKGEAGGNNAGLYTVYSLRGVTGEQLRARAPEAADLMDAVHRLGKLWQKDYKGQRDFSTAWWKKQGI